jgi:hypothetical protein
MVPKQAPISRRITGRRSHEHQTDNVVLEHLGSIRASESKSGLELVDEPQGVRIAAAIVLVALSACAVPTTGVVPRGEGRYTVTHQRIR